MNTPAHILALQTAANLADQIAGLPAVASLDWCDRAAECLLTIPSARLAGVLIATITEHGRVTDHEAAGFAAPASDPRGRDRLMWARSRAESLRSIGWSPATPAALRGPTAGVLSELPGGGAWRTGPVGQILEEPLDGELAIANAALGDHVNGRCIIAMVLCQPDLARPAADLLRAVMPLLTRRALLAIGPARSTRNHWLSPREQLVLEQLILGKSVREIADQLGRSPHTVHDHVKSLHRKLDASSRGELVARALGHHLTSPQQHGTAVPTLSPDEILAEPKPPVPAQARRADDPDTRQ